ncbi:MAG TPA: GNAT family N-acetyltransferase [Candidatus Paceibacterota bacterium]
MTQIKITPAKPEDARAIREVQFKTWLATYPNAEVGITVEDIEDRYKDSFSDESIRQREDQIKNAPTHQRTFVAKEEEKVVGFCIVVKYEDKNQLMAIYILPEYQQKGIGGLLWQEAQKFFDKEKPTIVQVATYNVGAINFYKKLGFKDTGKRFADERFKMKSGAIIPEMEMEIKA